MAKSSSLQAWYTWACFWKHVAIHSPRQLVATHHSGPDMPSPPAGSRTSSLCQAPRHRGLKSPPCPPGRCPPAPKVSKKPASHRAHPHSPAPTPPSHQAAHAVHSSELWFLSKVLSGRRPFLGQHRGLSRWDLDPPCASATARSNTLHLTEATMTLPPPPEGPAFAQVVPWPGGPS